MRIKLEHVALAVQDHKEIDNFYKNILEMNQIKSFTLNKELANTIFGVNKTMDVFLLEKNGVYFEIFVDFIQPKQNVNHICIAINNRKKLFKKSKESNYESVLIKKNHFDLMFIKDKSGNIFELKEKS